MLTLKLLRLRELLYLRLPHKPNPTRITLIFWFSLLSPGVSVEQMLHNMLPLRPLFTQEKFSTCFPNSLYYTFPKQKSSQFFQKHHQWSLTNVLNATWYFYTDQIVVTTMNHGYVLRICIVHLHYVAQKLS